MAKCVQMLGVPVRMSNDDAFQFVDRDHIGHYCSKRLWRDDGRRVVELGPKGKVVDVDTLQTHAQRKKGW